MSNEVQIEEGSSCGEVHSSCHVEWNVASTACPEWLLEHAPKRQVSMVSLVKCAPVTRIVVPPRVGPEEGKTDATVGVSLYVYTRDEEREKCLLLRESRTITEEENELVASEWRRGAMHITEDEDVYSALAIVVSPKRQARLSAGLIVLHSVLLSKYALTRMRVPPSLGPDVGMMLESCSASRYTN